MKTISLVPFLLLSSQIGIAAPAAPALSTPSAPRAGEISLQGTIESLDVVRNTLSLRATDFSVGAGAMKPLPQPKTKVIQLGDATQFLESSGLKNLSLGDLEKGLKIRVVGREIVGKPLAARLVSWRAPAPQLALDPLTPRLKAPFLPAPQTQNGITLRIVDAGWKSLGQMWSYSDYENARPMFYFAYNLPGDSDGGRDSAGWASSIAERNTRLLGVSGPNGEPVQLNTSGTMEREQGVYGAQRAAFSGVNPTWDHVVAEFETLDPAAPAGASGEWNSVLGFDKVPIPTKTGEKVVIDQEKTTALGSKIVLRTLRIEKPANGDKGRTYFDFGLTPPAKTLDMKISLDVDKIKNEDDNVWPYNSWGSSGNELRVEIAPAENDKFLVPSIKVKESALSLKKLSWYRRFRVEIPVATFLKIDPPRPAPNAPVFAVEGRAFTVQTEPENLRRTGTWSGTAWIKSRAGADPTERWMLREVKGRVGDKEITGYAEASTYDRQFMHLSATPATPDEHSNPFEVRFSERPDKFDLEMKVEKAHRLESFGWLRGVPLPAPGGSLDIRDGQFENDNVRVRRLFWFKNGNELAGLSPSARENFVGAGLAVVIETLPIYPGATVEIPSFRVKDNTGRQIDVPTWMPSGDAGREGTQNTKLRTMMFPLTPASKSLDLWFNTLETMWSGQSEIVTVKDVMGKG